MSRAGAVLFFVAVCLFAIPWARAAGDDKAGELAALLEQLEANFKTVQTIQCDLTQEKRLEVFDDVMVSTGQMVLRLPDVTRWEYTAPVRSVMILRQDQARMWHENTGKVETFRLDRDPIMKRVADQVSGWLRADFASLRGEYEIELQTTSPARLRLTPRDQAVLQFVKSVEVEFAAPASHMRQLTINEAGGDWTRLTFTNVRVNAPLANDAFEARPR